MFIRPGRITALPNQQFSRFGKGLDLIKYTKAVTFVPLMTTAHFQATLWIRDEILSFYNYH